MPLPADPAAPGAPRTKTAPSNPATSTAPAAPGAPQDRGALPAIELVRAPAGLAEAAAELLRHVVVTADLDEARGIVRLPATQEEALDALAADDVLLAALGPVLAESYLAVRRSEWAAYSEGGESFEQQGHFLKY